MTVVHSRSRNLPEITRSADIVIAAIGRAEFLTADHVREGASLSMSALIASKTPRTSAAIGWWATSHLTKFQRKQRDHARARRRRSDDDRDANVQHSESGEASSLNCHPERSRGILSHIPLGRCDGIPRLRFAPLEMTTCRRNNFSSRAIAGSRDRFVPLHQPTSRVVATRPLRAPFD